MAINDPSGFDVLLSVYQQDREANSEKFKAVFDKLEAISANIAAMRAETDQRRLWGGYVLPSIFGAAAAWLVHKLGLS